MELFSATESHGLVAGHRVQTLHCPNPGMNWSDQSWDKTGWLPKSESRLSQPFKKNKRLRNWPSTRNHKTTNLTNAPECALCPASSWLDHWRQSSHRLDYRPGSPATSAPGPYACSHVRPGKPSLLSWKSLQKIPRHMPKPPTYWQDGFHPRCRAFESWL